MKKLLNYLCILFFLSFSVSDSYSQKASNSINLITSSDLESYVTFLASPLLKGRMNGEEGLEIAAQYIASQAKILGSNRPMEVVTFNHIP